MKSFDIIIIGGGPAGFAAAMSARNTHPRKSIAIIRKEETALIPCGIPYTVHRLESVEDDILPDAPLANAGITLLIDEIVEREGNTLCLGSGERAAFERLIIAGGSEAVIPPIPGADLDGVMVVRKSMAALRELKQAVKEADNVAVVGGGYVGVEFADEMLNDGKKVTIVDQCQHLFPLSMDPEFSEMAEAAITGKGARLVLGTPVAAFEGEERVKVVRLEDGTRIPCDLVILAVGYRPNLELARRLDVAANQGSGIVVDEYMRTSVPGIFAAGDCVEERHFFTGESWPIMLASTAMAQGRLAGSNLYSIKAVKPFRGVLGTFSTMVGDTAFGVSGLTEEQARTMGVDYVVGSAKVPDRHPGKLNDASTIVMKLVFARHSHLLLGGQIKGGSSVGELANMLAVMIQKEMTDMEIDTLQIGTHPLLTSSPVVYPVIAATVDAISKWYRDEEAEIA